MAPARLGPFQPELRQTANPLLSLARKATLPQEQPQGPIEPHHNCLQPLRKTDRMNQSWQLGLSKRNCAVHAKVSMRLRLMLVVSASICYVIRMLLP